MASVLVIGVGSTGLAIMEQAQQFYYEFTKQDSPGKDNSAFLFIETDASKHASRTPNGTTDIVGCSIATNNNITATLTGWQQSPQQGWEWIPQSATVLDAGKGAAGQPIYGRVALWANETAVRKQIQKLYQQISGNGNTNIYIVGSLTGGTGTGIFIDLAYMVRQITANDNLYGMFLLPDRTNVGQQTKDVLYENAFSSIRSLDKFSKSENNKNYECTLPGGTTLDNLKAPFTNVQFLTQDFSDASASMTGLKELIQSAGFNLVLRYLDLTNQAAPFQDLVNARLVDYMSYVPNGNFTTIGFNMFQYPESLLEEYFTTDLLEKELLKQWVNATNYYDSITKTSVPIVSLQTKLKIEIYKFVQEAIDGVISQCQGSPMLGKTTFKNAIQAEIDIIQSGNYKAPSKEHYIFSLLDSASKTPKFYASISGQNTMLRDALVEVINKKINEESTKYQNLYIIDFIVKEIINDFQKIMNEWSQRFKINGTPSQWNMVWHKLVEERIQSGGFIYKITNCSKEWLTESLVSAATICYYDTLIPMLQDIVGSMSNKNGVPQLVTNKGIKLPTQQNVKEILGKVNELLNVQQIVSISARKSNIVGQLQNTGNPQLNFLFSGDSYKKDVENAESKYQIGTARLSYSTISATDLWDYLDKQDVIDLKSDMIKKAMIFIQGLRLFANTDIVNIMKNMQTSHRLYNKVNNLLKGTQAQIESDVPAMCHLINTEQFKQHQCLKLICVSPVDANVQAGIVAQLQNDYKPSQDASNFVVLPSMKNTIVIYQEYGYLGQVNGAHKTFNPLLHLSYQQQVFNSIKTKIDNNNFDDKLRLAYLDTQTLLNLNNLKIK